MEGDSHELRGVYENSRNLRRAHSETSLSEALSQEFDFEEDLKGGWKYSNGICVTRRQEWG